MRFEVKRILKFKKICNSVHIITEISAVCIADRFYLRLKTMDYLNSLYNWMELKKWEELINN